MLEAITLLQQGEIKKSEEMFTAIIASSDDKSTLSSAYYNRVFLRLFALKVNDFEGINKAVEYEPSKNTYLLKSIMHLFEEELVEARSACDQALLLEPECGVALYTSCRIYYSTFIMNIRESLKREQQDDDGTVIFKLRDIAPYLDFKTTRSKLLELEPTCVYIRRYSVTQGTGSSDDLAKICLELLDLNAVDHVALDWLTTYHRDKDFAKYQLYFNQWLNHDKSIDLRMRYIKELIEIKKYDEAVTTLSEMTGEKQLSLSQVEVLAQCTEEMIENYTETISQSAKIKIFAHFIREKTLLTLSESLEKSHTKALSEVGKTREMSIPDAPLSVISMSNQTSTTVYLPLTLVLSNFV